MLALGIDPGTAICGYGVVEMQGGRMKPVFYGSIGGAGGALLLGLYLLLKRI